ncbi:TNF receptor-associated factor 4-like [Clytia hemisphaerica]|uniref:TNF receptor-associated factor 4-like n=1 Tax=Clytia hemisphaerica TaxID=252671 RepID=UPI0034D60B20|eukprot:TCONS_00050870-protein
MSEEEQVPSQAPTPQEPKDEGEEPHTSPKVEEEQPKEEQQEEAQEEQKPETPKSPKAQDEEEQPPSEEPSGEEQQEQPAEAVEQPEGGEEVGQPEAEGDEGTEEQAGSRPASSASIMSNSSSMRGMSPIAPQERFKVTFLLPLEKQYTCPQCKDVLRYPVQFEECGHRVCSSCYHEYLRVEPRCPVDQVSINRDKCSLDKELNMEIMSLEAKCNNNEWGCRWEGYHNGVQEHMEECEYADILCVNDCGAKFQRRFQQKHLDKDCRKKIISCAFCDSRFLREEKKLHLEDCLKVPLPCPNKCDKKLTIARDELDKHIEEDCPRTKIVCQFEEIGCPHRCAREKLARHYKTGIIEHVRLLYDIIMKQGQRLDQHHELLQDHGALLETHQTRLADMERVNRTQLIWRIDEFGRKMKEAKNGNTPTLFSPPFYTSRHGYRLAASLCLNGDGKGKGTHISAFISILKGAYDNLLKWPFSYRVSFYLLDQNNDPSLRKHIRFSIKPNPCPDNEPFLGQPKKIEKNASFGGAKFANQEEVESRTYVKDDVIYLKIAVDCDGTAEP